MRKAILTLAILSAIPAFAQQSQESKKFLIEERAVAGLLTLFKDEPKNQFVIDSFLGRALQPYQSPVETKKEDAK